MSHPDSLNDRLKYYLLQLPDLGNQEWCIKMILFIYIGTKSKTFAVNYLVQACVSSSAANILYLLFGFRIVSRLLYRCLVTSM